MRRRLIAASAVLATMTAFPAVAVDNGLYLGGSLGQSRVVIDDVGFGGGDFSSDAAAFKVIAGWRLLDWLSIEGVGLPSDDSTDLAHGVGAQFRVWDLGLRAEYEQFDIDGADTIDPVSLGVTWTFL